MIRLRVANLLDSLSPDDWNAPSLCRRWRVRDVAGHLALIPTITTRDMIAVGRSTPGETSPAGR
jgi:uncharacterized protein (TIGR03083 family)